MFRQPLGPPRRETRTLRPLLGLLAATAFLAAPLTALGHAALETMTPADKSSGPAPSEIVGTFAQNLDPAKSSFTLVDAGGTVVAKGGEVANDAPRTMTLSLATPLAPGAYTIRWTTVSTEDGETARGTTSFTVIAAAPSPSATPTPSASGAASAAPSVVPSPTATVAASPSPSAAPSAPASSTADALIPIIVALIVLGAIGAWLLRGRGRGAR